MAWIIPIDALGSPDSVRKLTNAIFAQISGALPTYGAALPPAAGQDGRLFTVTGTNKLYQLRGGAWVALT